MNYVFIVFTISCLIYALVRKRFIFLVAPIVVLMIYVAVQILLVPLPIHETIAFIFNLR